jgi:hypothetical protein
MTGLLGAKAVDEWAVTPSMNQGVQVLRQKPGVAPRAPSPSAISVTALPILISSTAWASHSGVHWRSFVFI